MTTLVLQEYKIPCYPPNSTTFGHLLVHLLIFYGDSYLDWLGDPDEYGMRSRKAYIVNHRPIGVKCM